MTRAHQWRPALHDTYILLSIYQRLSFHFHFFKGCDFYIFYDWSCISSHPSCIHAFALKAKGLYVTPDSWGSQGREKQQNRYSLHCQGSLVFGSVCKAVDCYCCVYSLVVSDPM